MTNADVEALSANEVVHLRKLLDRQEIDDCLVRIARGTDLFDRELFLPGFHPGALVSVAGAPPSAEETYEGGRQIHADDTSPLALPVDRQLYDRRGCGPYRNLSHLHGAQSRRPNPVCYGALF